MSECTHHDNRGWFLNADSQCMLCGIRFDPNTLLNALEAEVERLKKFEELADWLKEQIASASGVDNVIDASLEFEVRHDALKEFPNLST